jgi:OOP family OmpA-OmpF porin
MNRIQTLMAVALAATLGIAADARAQDGDDAGKWYLAPMLYGTYLGNSRNADDDWSYGLVAGKNLTDVLSVELGYTHGKFDGKPATLGQLELDALSVDTLFHFYRQSRIHPFVSVGLVTLDETRLRDTNRRLDFQAGLGLLANLYTNPTRSGVLQLRGEVKTRWTLIDEPSRGKPADVLAGIGLQFNWGKPAPVAVAAPIAAAVAETPPPPADSDGDGVIDPNDKCPGTPAGRKVDANGCELDSDGDGVVDSMDKCPDTPRGTKVGPMGCPCDLTAQVTFKTASAELTTEGKATLDGVAEQMKRLNWVSGVVEGHTDSVGKDEYNQKLSERRAASVRDYLTAKGIGDGRMTAAGFGESRPVADNKTEEGRAQNRRVVLRRTDCDAPK